jgi:hypothetical protein|tara:strand:+ start:13300 stop:13581 length:282 start_codon:yes stop_codon:yes gene_type:complete
VSPAEQQNVDQLAARVEFLEDRIMDALMVLKENQERMSNDISKIKEAVYNPDNGLYARLRLLEEDVKQKNKFLWLLLSMGVGAIATAILSHMG